MNRTVWYAAGALVVIAVVSWIFVRYGYRRPPGAPRAIATSVTPASFAPSDDDAIRIARGYGNNVSYGERMHPDYGWMVVSRYSVDYSKRNDGAIDSQLGEAPEQAYPIREVCLCINGSGGYYFEVRLDTKKVVPINGNPELEARYGLSR
ncbi:MAG TPA: hypothetical protein VMU38_11895 [Candidatus Binatia bacterium]|nr:hypothetical protein [Candidatus Binatia bacterium]